MDRERERGVGQYSQPLNEILNDISFIRILLTDTVKNPVGDVLLF